MHSGETYPALNWCSDTNKDPQENFRLGLVHT
jgi:hypothetical protein